MNVVTVHVWHFRWVYKLVNHLLSLMGCVICWRRYRYQWLSVIWTLRIISQHDIVLLCARCLWLCLAASWFALGPTQWRSWFSLIHCCKLPPLILGNVLLLILNIVVVSCISVEVSSVWCSYFMERIATRTISRIWLSMTAWLLVVTISIHVSILLNMLCWDLRRSIWLRTFLA